MHCKVKAGKSKIIIPFHHIELTLLSKLKSSNIENLHRGRQQSIFESNYSVTPGNLYQIDKIFLETGYK